jgi:hypothetical protein
VALPSAKLPVHVPEAQSHESVEDAVHAGKPDGGNVVCAVLPSLEPPSVAVDEGPRVQS